MDKNWLFGMREILSDDTKTSIVVYIRDAWTWLPSGYLGGDGRPAIRELFLVNTSKPDRTIILKTTAGLIMAILSQAYGSIPRGISIQCNSVNCARILARAGWKFPATAYTDSDASRGLTLRVDQTAGGRYSTSQNQQHPCTWNAHICRKVGYTSPNTARISSLWNI